jgi:hypothetical protein
VVTPSTLSPSSIATPPGGGCDLVYSDLALPNSITGGLWVGRDGVYAGFVSANTFDFRPYRLIHITLSYDAITGGTTPTGQLLVMKVDDAAPISSIKQITQMTVTATIPAAGGGVEGYYGEAALNAGMTVGGGFGTNPAGFVGRIDFCKVGFSFSGSPTGVTNGRIFIWGYR